jgi:hypothetical protein
MEYDFYNVAAKSGKPSKAKYIKPKAVVYGTERGVPFRLVYKSIKAAEALVASTFGSKLVLI